MLTHKPPEPIDYLVIGHLSRDITPEGSLLGGTAAYAALTAHALGLRVGIVTAVGNDVSLERVEMLPIAGFQAENSTSFENIHTPTGRIQKIHHIAPTLAPYIVPTTWRNTPIVHFGPLAQEIDLDLFRIFPDSFIGITPQGWLRNWDKDGNVFATDWPEARFVLEKSDAVVLSIDDVKEPKQIQEMAAYSKNLVVTANKNGASLYKDGEIIHTPAPQIQEFNSVGAGDIFAAIFFIHLFKTEDPVAALNFATVLASQSITRSGLDSIPTPDEIRESFLAVT